MAVFKRWVVLSNNPRSTHAAIDGEEVGIDDTFSNGLRFPGDPSGSADETAGCTCVMSISGQAAQPPPTESDPLETLPPGDEVRFDQPVPEWMEAPEGTEAQQAAVRAYTREDTGKDLNYSLWNDRPDPKYEPMIADLDDLVANAPPLQEPTLVYHGLRVDPATIGATGLDTEAEVLVKLQAWADAEFPAGRVIDMKGFTSTSLGVNPALDASLSRTTPGVVFEIVTERGAYITPYSFYDDEAELLLGRHTALRVVRVLHDVEYERDFDVIVKRTVVQVVPV